MKSAFFLLIKITISGGIFFTRNSTLAQITPDTTLPNNSQIRLKDNIRFIEGGTQAGGNLFHSFRDFSVPTNSIVDFKNATGIQNILTRVTGGAISNIDGLIRVSENVNLFLINPSGIIFGQNARLDIGGSFIVSTANSLKFADGFEFSAKNPQSNPLLTINVPIGLQIGSNPGNIVNQSQARNNRNEIVGLTVQNGKSLGLVGGNISLDGGKLIAVGGTVELGGLAASGTVDLLWNGNNINLNFPDSVVRSDVSLTNKSSINTTSNGGGNIAISAKNLNILTGSSISSGIRTGSRTVGSQSGNLTINATESVKIDGRNSIIENKVNDAATGNGGDINIKAGIVSVTGGSQLLTRSAGRGNAGRITIDATDKVNIASLKGNGEATIGSDVFGENAIGNGNGINITAGSIIIENDAVVAASIRKGRGENGGAAIAGNVNIQARDEVVFKSGGRAYSEVGGNSFGNGGNVNIKAPKVSLNNARLITQLQAEGKGKAGDINITTDSLIVSDKTELTASSSGQGDAGNVIIKARDNVSFDKSYARSRVLGKAQGQGGNVNISTGSLTLTGGSQLSTSIYGKGDAGNIIIEASGNILFDSGDAFSTVEAGAKGDGGDININSWSLSLTNGGGLNTFLRGTNNKLSGGQGTAGNININTHNAVTISGGGNNIRSGIYSGLYSGAIGNGGNIDIKTESVSMTGNVEVLARSAGEGNAGSVTINATDKVYIASFKDNARATIGSDVLGDKAIGNGNDINITAGSIIIENDAVVAASIREGRGKNGQAAIAGNVNIKARDEVVLRGRGRVYSEVGENSFGIGGNVNITTPEVSLNNSQLITRLQANGKGEAGDINITADSLSLSNNGQIIARTYGDGKAGDIGITTNSLSVSNNSQLTVASSGQGSAGNIEVNASQVILNNRGLVIAESASGNGGNITLRPKELLLLDRRSLISATAGTERKGGDGGYITISSPNGFIVAFPRGNSDITANAFTGNGGKVAINAFNIFGIQARSREYLEKQGQTNPIRLLTNDITAISQENPTLIGTVSINTPEVDPNRGVAELPQYLVNAAGLINQHFCARAYNSSFIITGRGGIAPSPFDTFNGETTWEDWRVNPIAQKIGEGEKVHLEDNKKPLPENPVIEAQGWIMNDKGQVELVASTQNVTPHRLQSLSLECLSLPR